MPVSQSRCQVHRQGEARLREHFSQPIAAQPVRNQTRSVDDEDPDTRREQRNYRANSRDFATL